jgi:Tol biopolymer transport system component
MRVVKSAFLLLLFVVLSFGCASVTPLTGKIVDTAAFSPDGKSIVLSARLKPDSQLYKGNTDGTGFVQLTNSPTRDSDPVFSPDGTRIAFSHVSNGQGDICVMKIDGSEKKCLTSGPENDIEPLYSPDGSKIYFSRASKKSEASALVPSAWQDWDIYAMNADGTDVKKITSQGTNREIGSLSINQKGDTLMASGIVCPGAVCMFPISDPLNKKAVKPDLDKYQGFTLLGFFADDYSTVRNPQLSPDGEHILFTWPNFDALYVMDLKTNTVTKLWKYDAREKCRDGVCNPDQIRPRFSPDGKKIIFSTLAKVQVNILRHSGLYGSESPEGVQEPKLWIINIDGTGLRAIDVK